MSLKVHRCLVHQGLRDASADVAVMTLVRRQASSGARLSYQSRGTPPLVLCQTVATDPILEPLG
jgi:hypothetical protein